MYHVYCFVNRYKRGWFHSNFFKDFNDVLLFLTYVKKSSYSTNKFYFYKVVDEFKNTSYFKVTLGLYSNKVDCYYPDKYDMEGLHVTK